eukprot:15480898-Alexandrium_andersonii.AAC.1
MPFLEQQSHAIDHDSTGLGSLDTPEAAAGSELPSLKMLFANLLWVPGCLHICHGATGILA